MAFKDIVNSIGVRQHVSGPTHSHNHTLDLILSHGIDVDAVEILQQSDDISDHYLVLCKLHLAKAAKPTPCFKYVRPITSATKDCFINNLPDQFHHLSIPDSLEELEVFHISWKDSTIAFREALKAARSAYFSTLLEENK